MDIETFPDQDTMMQLRDQAFPYMRPNELPMAVTIEGALTVRECGDIQRACEELAAYKHEGCGAMTREVGHIPELEIIKHFAVTMNSLYWEYVLDAEPFSWMQSYLSEGDYPMHTDGRSGQMRKLTAVALLSHPREYSGGTLQLHQHPAMYRVPKTQGTIVVFQPWVWHRVTPVGAGIRKTINMGFWGPNFR